MNEGEKMNVAQLEYLKKFCEGRGIDQETALQYEVVKLVLKQLESSKTPEVTKVTEQNISMNCS